MCLPGSSSRWAGLHTNAGSMRTLNKKAAAKLNSFRDPLGAAIKALEDNLKGLHEVCVRARACSRSQRGRAPIRPFPPRHKLSSSFALSLVAASSHLSSGERPMPLSVRAFMQEDEDDDQDDQDDEEMEMAQQMALLARARAMIDRGVDLD